MNLFLCNTTETTDLGGLNVRNNWKEDPEDATKARFAHRHDFVGSW